MRKEKKRSRSENSNTNKVPRTLPTTSNSYQASPGPTKGLQSPEKEKKILQNKRQQQHSKDVVLQKSQLELGKQASTDLKKGPFQWTISPSPQKLYNEFITQAKKKYLTEKSLKQAIKFISTPPFCLFEFPSTQVMIFDMHNEKQIVGLLKFIRFSRMTCDELNDLDFLTEFFHYHKSFVNSVSNFNSTCLGGKMNMLGWKKSGLIIGKSFKQLANNAFLKKPQHYAASSVSYKYDGFYNTPHKEKQGASKFSFFQWIPTFSKTGRSSTHAQGFNVQGGEFVFPDCKFGLGFEKLDGISRMVWRATDSTSLSCFQQHQAQPASYEGLNDGDLDHIFNTVEQHKKKKK
ncbi:hypothetical protein VP01_1117g2 [Puccinia sorghi]|uniref:Tet-like 2OG-Fe(II) oxygenase domain-containing protein n=1 Tax=Puccinia sorghi TaxID=27349 RepID=A0A0L6VSQ8_9BASI|nr:hypothetical protein VP01_1117g2 [Puccinia sorghi]